MHCARFHVKWEGEWMVNRNRRRFFLPLLFGCFLLVFCTNKITSKLGGNSLW